MRDEPLLMTEQEMADLLRIAPRTVRKLRKAGRILDPLPLGSDTPRWNAGEVRRWIESDCPPADRWREMRGKADATAVTAGGVVGAGAVTAAR